MLTFTSRARAPTESHQASNPKPPAFNAPHQADALGSEICEDAKTGHGACVHALHEPNSKVRLSPTGQITSVHKAVSQTVNRPRCDASNHQMSQHIAAGAGRCRPPRAAASEKYTTASGPVRRTSAGAEAEKERCPLGLDFELAVVLELGDHKPRGLCGLHGTSAALSGSRPIELRRQSSGASISAPTNSSAKGSTDDATFGKICGRCPGLKSTAVHEQVGRYSVANATAR